MGDTTLKLDDGGIAEITIDRADQRNALRRQTIVDLTGHFEGLNNHPNVKCVILQGAGDKAFCAGADLEELASQNSLEERRTFFRSIARLITAIHRLKVPVIAKVHGFAMAGGMGLVAASDLVYASDDAVFGLPEAAVGLAPLVVSAPIIKTIGSRAFSELSLSAERIDAARALDLKLATKIVPKAELNAEVKKIAVTLSGLSVNALIETKRALIDSYGEDYFRSLNELAEKSAIISLSDEATSRINSFLEKKRKK